MALRNYYLRSPSVVILDDDRNPWTSWRNHVNRAGRGGVDVVAKVGTPIYARTDGRMWHRPNNGSAGNSSEFAHDANPGWRDVFSHMSRYVGESGKWFPAGALIGYTGNTGGVTEHLHWHLLDPQGNRRNPWDYFTAAAAPAAAAATPLPLPIAKGANQVFIITRKGWTALVLPADKGMLYAQVLGGQDKTELIPIVRKDDNLAWEAFKDRFVNRNIMPS